MIKKKSSGKKEKIGTKKVRTHFNLEVEAGLEEVKQEQIEKRKFHVPEGLAAHLA